MFYTSEYQLSTYQQTVEECPSCLTCVLSYDFLSDKNVQSHEKLVLPCDETTHTQPAEQNWSHAPLSNKCLLLCYLILEYEYVGCFTDSKVRLLDGKKLLVRRSMSASICNSLCNNDEHPFPYFGTEVILRYTKNQVSAPFLIYHAKYLHINIIFNLRRV